jgi:purine-binding chemotaxis protein CheW
VLYADIGPLELALPLAALSGVVAWPEHLSTLPGQASWVLGVSEHLGRRIKVAHTATVVRPAGSPPVDVAYSRIVVLADLGWGLACRGVSDVAALTPDDVRWRLNARQRPWLAGTVVARMTALADAGRLSAWLDAGGPGP